MSDDPLTPVRTAAQTYAETRHAADAADAALRSKIVHAYQGGADHNDIARAAEPMAKAEVSSVLQGRKHSGPVGRVEAAATILTTWIAAAPDTGPISELVVPNPHYRPTDTRSARFVAVHLAIRNARRYSDLLPRILGLAVLGQPDHPDVPKTYLEALAGITAGRRLGGELFFTLVEQLNREGVSVALGGDDPDFGPPIDDEDEDY